MKIFVKGNPLAFLNQVNVCEVWTASDDQIILDIAKVSNPWRKMASKLGRSPSACLGRYEELVSDSVSPLLEANARIEQQIKDLYQHIQELRESQLQDKKETKRQASIVHQKFLESLEMQPGEVMSEQVTETISALQGLESLGMQRGEAMSEQAVETISFLQVLDKSQLQDSKGRKRQASIVELRSKHQKCLESLEMRRGEAMEMRRGEAMSY